MKGPGAWIGAHFDPVKAPQIKKMVMTEITEADRSAVTALSSPKVTVLSEVKSWAWVSRPAITFTTKKAITKMAT